MRVLLRFFSLMHLPNLHYFLITASYFQFNALWLAVLHYAPYFWWEYNMWFTPFLFTPISGTQLGRKRRPGCTYNVPDPYQILLGLSVWGGWYGRDNVARMVENYAENRKTNSLRKSRRREKITTLRHMWVQVVCINNYFSRQHLHPLTLETEEWDRVGPSSL
jgi:hypothetical protein